MKEIIDFLPKKTSEIFRSTGWDRRYIVKDLTTYEEKELSSFQTINHKFESTPVAYIGNDSWLVDETDQARYCCDRGLYTDIYKVQGPIEVTVLNFEGHTLNTTYAYAGDIVHFFRGGPGYEEQLQIFHVPITRKNLRFSYAKNDNEPGWFFVDAQVRRSVRKRNYRRIFGKKISDGGFSTRHTFRIVPYKEKLVGEFYDLNLYETWDD